MPFLSFLFSSSSRVSYRFHLAHSTYGGHGDPEQRETVYVSQPERHQIIALKRVIKTDGGGDRRQKDKPLTEEEAEDNWKVVVGTGERCLPGDGDRCGDGGKAKQARLAYPKGTIMHAHDIYCYSVEYLVHS